MIIGSIKEYSLEETRVSLTPSVVKTLIADGHLVLLEKNIGKKSGFSDKDYIESGATISDNITEIYNKSHIILQIQPPKTENLQLLNKTQLLCADFSNYNFSQYNKQTKILRLEQVPRTSTAQSIDILSSQHTVRGYMSALYTLFKSPKMAPQLMTSATSIKPATALVIGSSITGLQASAVFKRNGCKVTILDINEQNKELAQSVGAELVTVNDDKELSLLLNNKNFILASASSQNKETPIIIEEKHLNLLSNGAIVVDTTTQNINIKKDTQNKDSYHFYRNLYFERLCPITASELWANNMLHLLKIVTTPNHTINLDINYISPMLYQGE